MTSRLSGSCSPNALRFFETRFVTKNSGDERNREPDEQPEEVLEHEGGDEGGEDAPR